MGTRTMIGLGTAAGIAGAAYAIDLAAPYVAIARAAIVYLLHTIEFELNKLLDYTA